MVLLRYQYTEPCCCQFLKVILSLHFRLATLPRQPQPRSTRRLEQKLLVDRLDQLMISAEAGSDESEDNFEVEPGFPECEEGFPECEKGFPLYGEREDGDGKAEDCEYEEDSGAGSQSLSGIY